MKATIEEQLRRLKPAYGKSIDSLWLSYLTEDSKGKKEIEEIVPILTMKGLNESYDEDKINLVPPSQQQADGEYRIGNVEYADKGFYPFGLREDEWIQHLSIFGRSGSGKTNLVLGIIKSFLEKKKPFLIFDWKRNYRDMFTERKDILVFTIGRDISPFRFNPLIPPPGTDPEVWLKKLVEIIAHAYFLGEGVIYLLHKTLNAIYREFGIYEGKTYNYPTMRDVLTRIYNMKLKGRQSLWWSSTLRAIYSLCFGEVGKIFCVDRKIPIESLLNKNVIFELDSLTNTDKTFFIEALLLWIHHYRMANGKREDFKHAIVIEEAHHILLRRKQELKGEETVTDIILREIRELGESIIIVDQHPSLISPTAIGNTFCTIAMNLKHRNDVHIMNDALLLQDKKDVLSKLPVGYGIVKLQGRYYDPFLIRVPLHPIRKGICKDPDIRARMKGYFRSYPLTLFRGLNEFNGISGISGRDKVSNREMALLKDIIQYPISSVKERYSRLNLNVRDGTIIQHSLIDRRLIQPVTISHRDGWIKLFDITPIGRDELNSIGFNGLPTQRKGGVEHQYWVNKIAKDYNNKGYMVEIEKSIGNGKTIDIEAQKGNEKVAIEVETGKSDAIENIRKCLDFGYNRVISLVTTWDAYSQLQKDVQMLKLDAKVRIVCVKNF